MKFDHIGSVVQTPEIGRMTLAGAFQIRHWTSIFDDPVNDVLVQFGLDGSGLCYETVAPRSPRSPVTRGLADGMNIVNHVAHLVENLEAEGARLKQLGFIPTSGPKPAITCGLQPIQFFVSRTRLLFALIESPGHSHSFVPMASPIPKQTDEGHQPPDHGVLDGGVP